MTSQVRISHSVKYTKKEKSSLLFITDYFEVIHLKRVSVYVITITHHEIISCSE